MATVVSKLFCLAGRSTAVFGRKDYQQLAVIRRLARDLFFPVRVVGVATVREADGLAKSSRNRYLSPSDRARALAVPEALSAALRAFERGERRAGVLTELAGAKLGAVDSVDYVAVADADSLRPITQDETVGERALVAIACRLGTTRLIDNVVLGEDRDPLSRQP